MAESSAGHGVTLTMTGFTAEVVSLGGMSLSRESIETTSMDTVGGKTFIPSSIVDNGEVSVTVVHDPSVTPPISAAIGTVTITWPNGETWAFDGFCTGYDAGAESEERMEADLTLKVSGDVTYSG